jgi:hypothetical protein
LYLTATAPRRREFLCFQERIDYVTATTPRRWELFLFFQEKVRCVAASLR